MAPLVFHGYDVRSNISVACSSRNRGLCASLVISSTSTSSAGVVALARRQKLGLLRLQPATFPAYQQQHVQARRCATAGISSSKGTAYSVQHNSSNHKPLVQHMLELLLQYHNESGPVVAAEYDLREQQQQQQVKEVLHSSNLLHNQELYCWLNQQLQGLKVRGCSAMMLP
jgi:hypothetical protein